MFCFIIYNDLYILNYFHTLFVARVLIALGDNVQSISALCVRFLRARASIAIARISYGNSVRPSVCLFVCPGVTTRYRFKTR